MEASPSTPRAAKSPPTTAEDHVELRLRSPKLSEIIYDAVNVGSERASVLPGQFDTGFREIDERDVPSQFRQPGRVPPGASRKVERSASTGKQWLDMFGKCPRQERIRFQPNAGGLPIFLVPALALS